MPPELTGEAQPDAAPAEVPDLDVSEEVFPETPPAEGGGPPEPERAEAPQEGEGTAGPGEESAPESGDS
jgi:hypothetical protein